jgi:hypothetical protein
MSFLLELNDDNLAEQLPVIIEKFERELEKAPPLFEIHGERLEVVARTLPYHQVHFDSLAREAAQLVKWLENMKARIEARLTKNYLLGQRVYSARETTTLIAGEKEIIEINQLIIEASLIQQKLDAVVEAMKQLGWMLSHITKLRVEQLQDVIL